MGISDFILDDLSEGYQVYTSDNAALRKRHILKFEKLWETYRIDRVFGLYVYKTIIDDRIEYPYKQEYDAYNDREYDHDYSDYCGPDYPKESVKKEEARYNSNIVQKKYVYDNKHRKKKRKEMKVMSMRKKARKVQRRKELNVYVKKKLYL